MIRRVVQILVAFLFVSSLCAGQDITVAAAADLQSATQDIVGQFGRIEISG